MLRHPGSHKVNTICILNLKRYYTTLIFFDNILFPIQYQYLVSYWVPVPFPTYEQECWCFYFRSLVALSLILSLLLFKPAPLYILDEVDAALDLSHTQNIGQMLRTHFKHSQVSELDRFINPSRLPMLSLLSSKAQECKDLWKPSEPCHDGIHWIALAGNSQMSNYLPGIQSYLIGTIDFKFHL